MTLETAALMGRLRDLGVELEPAGDKLKWRSPVELPADLLEELREHKAEVLAALTQPLSPTAILRRRIAAARSWEDLGDVLSDAQVHYVNGELHGLTVEALARECTDASRRLPEHPTTRASGTEAGT